MIAIAVVSKCAAQDSIAWGAASAGLRLGLGAEAPNGNLHVILHNAGPASISVFVAMKSANRVDYVFQFTATAPDGAQYRIWDMEPQSHAPAAGLVVPEVIDLAPGSGREFTLPLQHLLYMAKGRQVSLGSMLQQGYGFNVTLEVRQSDLDGASMGGIPQPPFGHLWVGRLTCSFRLPKFGR